MNTKQIAALAIILVAVTAIASTITVQDSMAKHVKNPINGATKTPGRHGCAEGGEGFIHSGGKCNHANSNSTG